MMSIERRILTAAVFVSFLSSCVQPLEETKPIRKDVTEYVFGTGKLEAENEYTLTALTDGYITDFLVEENDLVNAGQYIATIANRQNEINTQYANQLVALANSNLSADAPALQQAEERVKIARLNLKNDSVNFDRHKKLMAANSITLAAFQNAELQYKKSESEYVSAQQNYKQLQTQARENKIINESQRDVYRSLNSENKVKAIHPGTVLQRFKNVGDFVRKGDPLIAIGDLTNLYFLLEIDEKGIRKVKGDQHVLIKINALRDTVIRGTVSEILPSYDEEKQSFLVKVKPTTPLDFKLVKTQVQANIEVGITKNALLIPKRFIDYSNRVYLKDNDKPVSVTVKYVSTEWVQVLSGLDDKSVIVLKSIPSK